MMCAIQAAARGKAVALLDHAPKIGRKILISGGGRCNFTNLGVKPECFVSQNPHFCKSALARFTQWDFIDLVKQHRIPFHEKTLGQLFCDQSAQQIVDMLLNECRSAGARFFLNTPVQKITKSDIFEITTPGTTFLSPALVIATGGLSIPQIGATGFGFDIARQFGLNLVPTAAALVGYDLNKTDFQTFKHLQGLAFLSQVTCGPAAFRENCLFTHTGLSGPAILQSSLYWHPQESIVIDTAPDTDIEAVLLSQKKSGSTKNVKNILAEHMPRRLAEQLCEIFLPASSINQIPDHSLRKFAGQLKSLTIYPQRTNGYRKAEVTRGGINTNELSSKTMESHKVPGLYFIGEVVDVTGWLGGYNFQWAWSSGYAAGQAV